MSFTFNGDIKRIYVNSATPDVSAQELYSDWKRWAIELQNLQYLQAFRTFGGDPTVEGQTAPAYYFLTNGWRIVVDGFDATFGYNLYTDEGESPVITLNGGTSLLNNSDVGIVTTDVERALQYNGEVVVDVVGGEGGDSYPIGTAGAPVDNIADAMTIAQQYDIKSLRLFTTLEPVLINASVSNMEIVGYGHDCVAIFDNSTFSFDYSNVVCRNLTIRGYFGGDHIQLEDCEVEGIQNFSGHVVDCTLEDIIEPMGNVIFKDCVSHEFGASRSVIQPYSGGDLTVAFRRYSGGLEFRNITSGNSTAEFSVGKCYINSTCTGGNISVRGVVLVDNQSGGITVDTSATVSDLVDLSSATINVGDIAVNVDNEAIAISVRDEMDANSTKLYSIANTLATLNIDNITDGQNEIKVAIQSNSDNIDLVNTNIQSLSTDVNDISENIDSYGNQINTIWDKPLSEISDNTSTIGGYIKKNLLNAVKFLSLK